MTRIAEIADRLHRLAKRREDEGIYTDAALCEEAAAYLTAALAAEPGEAVAWQQEYYDGGWSETFTKNPRVMEDWKLGGYPFRPLYAHPVHPLSLKEEVERVLAPFALVAEFDIGESETDEDLFRPVNDERHARAPRLTVGDLRAARALLSRLRAGAQEGWKLVPIEPTLAMQNAGWREIDSQGFQTEDTEVAPIYRAMLPAEPSPEAKGGRS